MSVLERHIKRKYMYFPSTTPQKGTPNRKLLFSVEHGARVFVYHATKGWRSYQKAKD